MKKNKFTNSLGRKGMAMLSLMLGMVWALPGYAQDSTALPFDYSAHTNQWKVDPAKKVFAHWHVYQISLDNNTKPEADAWMTKNLSPFAGGNLIHTGGIARERPLPRKSLPGSKPQWMTRDMETDVQYAIAAGLDGFFFSSNADFGNHERLYALLRAASKYPNFKIGLQPDATGNGRNKTAAAHEAYCAAIVSMVKGIKNNHDKSLFDTLLKQRFVDTDGKVKEGIVISPFNAEQLGGVQWWKNKVVDPLKAAGIPVCFMATFNGGWQKGLSADFRAIPCSGTGNFGVSGYEKIGSTASFVNQLHKAGQIWIQGITPQCMRPYPAGGSVKPWYAEANGSEQFQRSWKSAITSNADWTMIVTWNDYGEGCEMRPSTGIQYSFSDLNAFYSTWFKTGHAPQIRRDVLYYFHRIQPTWGKPDQASIWKFNCKTELSKPTDNIELSAFLTAPGTLQIQIGGKTYTKDAPAGQTTFRVPFAYGTPVFRLLRNNREVKSVESAFPIPNLPIHYQDLLYRGGSSSRDPVPMTDVYYNHAFVQPDGGTPTVTITASQANVAEAGAQTGVFTVTRTGNTGSALAVNLSVSGTALRGDYTPSIGSFVVIPFGQSSASIRITPTNDKTVEGDETVILKLSPQMGYKVGSSSQATVTISDNDVPLIVNPNNPSGTVGKAFSYRIQSTPAATRYDATPLPAGLKLNASTGVISGTPTAAGTSAINLSATLKGMTGTKEITMIINTAPGTPPKVSLAIDAAPEGGFRQPARVFLRSTATPSSGKSIRWVEFYNGSTLLNRDTSSPYAYSWTNVKTGSYSITAKVTDNTGKTGTSQAVIVNVQAPLPAAPVITSAASMDGKIGTDLSYQITATQNPTGYSAAGLPSGLSFNTSTGLISGKPTASGNFRATLGATNPGGTGEKILTLTIQKPAEPKPTVTLSVTDRRTSERWHGEAVWMVARTGNTSGALKVNYQFGGSATLDKDYHISDGSTAGYITIPAGKSSASIEVRAYSDQVKDDQETIVVTLKPDTSYILGSEVIGTANIWEDGQVPAVILVAPSEKLNAPAQVQLTAISSALDADECVEKVSFFNGSTLIGSDSIRPYQMVWNGVKAGTYSLTACVVEKNGVVNSSVPVVVKVQ